MILLALGAAAGITLAASGLVRANHNRGTALPPDAAARINGEVIRLDDYQRTIAGVMNDRRDGIDAAQRRQVLDRLIDEELLVQRALELGLARHDRKVRADLTAAMIASITADAEDVQPSDTELQRFYDANRALFTQPGRLRVRQVFCRAATAGDMQGPSERAQDAARRLRAGEPYDAVRDALGDHEVSPLPDALLPPEKLIDYLGPTALHAALSLAAGEVSEPVRSGVGFHVLQVVDRQADVTPALADIHPQVVTEFRRRAGEQALRTYLDDLRGRADVAVAAPLP